MFTRTIPAAAAAVILAATTLHADDRAPKPDPFGKVVARVSGMVGDPQATRLAAKHGLNVVNVTWEDTGRSKGSSYGPNISDVTIQVQTPKGQLHCMPVIRYPNFSDKTADLPPLAFKLLVGNESGKDLRHLSLTRYLARLRDFLHKPGSWKGKRASLLAPRDTAVLVSAQACLLPVPPGGKVEFNPVIFNYQSRAGDPAVLCILATREGTSATIIDNQRDSFASGTGAWGQRVFFNHKGERASLTGERQSDFEKRDSGDKPGIDGKRPSLEANAQSGLNMVLLIQVPLKQKQPQVMEEMYEGAMAMDAAPMAERSAGMENAVIGHGKVEGPFTEIDGVEIERDTRFPVRVTVQFYLATTSGTVTAKQMADIKARIDSVYKNALAVGSLVTTGITDRVTEHEGPNVGAPAWVEGFMADHAADTGIERAETESKLAACYGEDWTCFETPELLNDAIRESGGKPVRLSMLPTIEELGRPKIQILLAGLVALLGGVCLFLRRRAAAA